MTILPKKIPKICIVDYGMGNLKSVVNALNFSLDCNVLVSDRTKDLEEAEILILPGVGSFYDAMTNIVERGLFEALNRQVIDLKKPLVAICLGMHLIMDSSEEGEFKRGFGWIPGSVKKFKLKREFQVPHMGWNNIIIKKNLGLFKGIESNPDYYFVHSYHLECDESFVVASCNYGYEFPAVIEKDNILAFQFHPEKSHRNGLSLLRNSIHRISRKF